MKMDRFKCDGWLNITVNEKDPQTIAIRMTHYRHHIPYVDISIPNNIKKSVEDMKNLPASKMGLIISVFVFFSFI